MFTKNIWHNCAARDMPGASCPALCCWLWWEGGLLWDLMNPFCSQQWGMGPWCNARNALVPIAVMSYTGFNQTPWPLIVSQTACTAVPHCTVVRRESCSAAAAVVRCGVHLHCTAVHSPGQDRAGSGVQSVHSAQSASTVPAERSDFGKKWVLTVRQRSQLLIIRQTWIAAIMGKSGIMRIYRRWNIARIFAWRVDITAYFPSLSSLCNNTSKLAGSEWYTHQPAAPAPICQTELGWDNIRWNGNNGRELCPICT